MKRDSVEWSAIGEARTRVIRSALLAAAVAATVVPGVRAQGPTRRSADGAAAVATFRVRHDHAVGSGKGVLVITATGFEYRGTSDDEARHSHTWRDSDVKRLELDREKITLTTYEAGSIPVLPRQVPFVRETVAIPAGVEHRYEFSLLDGELSPAVAGALEARFPRPIASSIVASDAALGTLIFELPVFHRHRAGGHSGVLRVYEHRVVFAAETGPSHSWRYTDVRSISRLGDRRLEITTDEGQFGPGGRDYVFDLKRPMRDREYEKLWSRVYEHRFGEDGE